MPHKLNTPPGAGATAQDQQPPRSLFVPAAGARIGHVSTTADLTGKVDAPTPKHAARSKIDPPTFPAERVRHRQAAPGTGDLIAPAPHSRILDRGNFLAPEGARGLTHGLAKLFDAGGRVQRRRRSAPTWGRICARAPRCAPVRGRRFPPFFRIKSRPFSARFPAALPAFS